MKNWVAEGIASDVNDFNGRHPIFLLNQPSADMQIFIYEKVEKKWKNPNFKLNRQNTLF